MATSNVIAPFPADIDRTAFGHWLSGFTDGEANFQLRLVPMKGKQFKQPVAYFRIALRDDDADILHQIRSFFQCGAVYPETRKPPTKPSCVYSVNGTKHLWKYVVPHFDRYPLRAKKSRDYSIWRTAVELMVHVQTLPDTYRSVANPLRTTKWTTDNREYFSSLVDALRSLRQYGERVHDLPCPTKTITTHARRLFD